MLLTVLVFLLILSVLVLIHEAGHFFAAKKLGIKVEEFGFGLPPRIFGVRRGETIYSINWLPIGGFVKLFGEEGQDDIGNKKAGSSEVKNRAFYTRPVWQRSIVLLAGVTMNFLLALIVISYLFTQGVMVPTDRVHVEKVADGSPAQKAGLKQGDVVIMMKVGNAAAPDKNVPGEVKEIPVKSGEQLITETKKHLGEEIGLVVVRDGKQSEVKLTPRKDYPKDQGPMGVVISNYEKKVYPVWQAPVYGTKEAINLSWELAKGIGMTVWKLISFQSVSKDVAGPIGIAQMTGQAVKEGQNSVLELLGLLSLNLAIVNVLPFPALDGGRFVFVVIEGITGKKVKTNWERYVHQVGMIILLTLMILVTLNDLVRVFSKK